MKKFRILLFILLIFALPPGVYAEESGTVKVRSEYRQSEARKITALVNTFRTGTEAWYYKNTTEPKTEKVIETDLDTLQYDITLERAAMVRAAQIALLFEHMLPSDGIANGSLAINGKAAGENILISSRQIDASKAMDLWKETDEDYSGQGHRRNMLQKGFKTIGVGCAFAGGVECWVQLFGIIPPDEEQTEAFDGTRDVPVTVLHKLVKSVEAFYHNNVLITISIDEKIPLSEMSVFVNTIDQDTSPKRTVPPALIMYEGEWKADDSSIVTISDGSLVGLMPGSTTVRGSVLGKNFSLSVKVKKGDISFADVSIEDQPYTGKKVKPAVTVTLNGNVLTAGTDYKVTYSDNKKLGTALATITGRGDYEGSKVEAFEIVRFGKPKGTKITDPRTKAVYKVTKYAATKKAELRLMKIPASVTSFAVPNTITFENVKYKITSINKKAAKASLNLKTLTVGKYVKLIGSGAFAGCKNLSRVNIKTRYLTVSSVKADAFKGIGKKAVVRVPADCLEAYENILKARGITGKRSIVS